MTYPNQEASGYALIPVTPSTFLGLQTSCKEFDPCLSPLLAFVFHLFESVWTLSPPFIGTLSAPFFRLVQFC